PAGLGTGAPGRTAPAGAPAPSTARTPPTAPPAPPPTTTAAAAPASRPVSASTCPPPPPPEPGVPVPSLEPDRGSLVVSRESGLFYLGAVSTVAVAWYLRGRYRPVTFALGLVPVLAVT